MKSLIPVIVVMALLILPMAGCGTPQAACPKIGDKAPDVTFIGMDDKNVSLSDYAGKPVIINTWYEACISCKKEMPYFNELFQKYSSNELVFLSINTMDGTNTIKDFLSKNGYTFNVLRDRDRKALNAKFCFPSSGPLKGDPYTIFIDNKGIIQNIKLGEFNSKDELMAEVNKILRAN
jgi:peroxiredoxin